MVAQSNRLVVTTPSDTEIVMTRSFRAPRELVWRAWTDPQHVRQWWGREGSTLTVCEIDLRVGGEWRYVERQADGSEYPFKGVYREIVPPERLVSTFIFDMEPFSEKANVDTLTLEEIDGGTRITTHTQFASKEDRDAMVESGMEDGANESMDRLDAHLQAIQ